MTDTLTDTEKSKDLSKLLDISLSMIEKTDLSSLLGLIMEEATKTMHADRSTLYLIDRERNELVSFIAQQSGIKEIRLPLGMGIAGHVAETGKTVNIEDAYKNPLFNKETDIQTGYITRTVLCVPMKNREGEIIGVLQVLNKKTGLFTEYDEWLFRTYAAYAATAIENARLHEEREKTFLSAIKALAAAIDRRDPVTAGHSERVARLSVDIGRSVGLAKNELKMLNYAATLHDVGKIIVPAEILSKPSELNEYEYGIIKSHPAVGYDILKGLEFHWPVAQTILQHHEMLDGTGYPAGLKGEEIILEARILAVADVVEAMSGHRPYRAALGIDKALEEISRNKDVLYDAKAVDACMRLFMEKGFRFEGWVKQADCAK